MNLNIAKDIVSVVAPLILIIIAWRGLSTWNRQLRGTRDSELSKRILVALYNAELMVREIRSPFVEYKLPLDTSPFDQDAATKAWAKHYEDKWKILAEYLAELRAASIEAKAVWSRDFMENLDPFFASINELNYHLNDHIQKKLDPAYSSIYEPKEIRNVVYSRSQANDEFEKKVNESINSIDEYVRKRLAENNSLRNRFFQRKLTS